MEKYLFIKQNYSPNDLLLSDLGLSFIYGIIITIIAIIVIILCNKSIYCYVSFILVIICNAVLSIVFSNISIPIIFLYSICECIDFNYKLAQPISLLIHISVILASLLILLNITINKKLVPHLLWYLELFITFSTVSLAPFSMQLIHLCSAP